jgi:hypothetical protein
MSSSKNELVAYYTHLSTHPDPAMQAKGKAKLAELNDTKEPAHEEDKAPATAKTGGKHQTKVLR